MTSSTRDRRIRPYTRILSIGLLPFLAVASVLLYVLPLQTDRLFSWTIVPPLSAMLLASAYLGGIWFFSEVLSQRSWGRVRRGVPAVLVFATLLGIATILHWDRFHAGHISFIVWAILYFTTPFLVVGAIVVQRGSDQGGAEHPDVVIPLAVRFVFAVLGAIAIAVGAVLFVAPQLVVDAWAWQLTPLTARVLGAMLMLPGVVNIQMIVDRRWSAFRTIMRAQLFSLEFLIGALAIARSDLVWSRAVTPLFVAGIVGSFVVYLAVTIWAERRVRAA